MSLVLFVLFGLFAGLLVRALSRGPSVGVLLTVGSVFPDHSLALW